MNQQPRPCCRSREGAMGRPAIPGCTHLSTGVRCLSNAVHPGEVSCSWPIAGPGHMNGRCLCAFAQVVNNGRPVRKVTGAEGHHLTIEAVRTIVTGSISDKEVTAVQMLMVRQDEPLVRR